MIFKKALFATVSAAILISACGSATVDSDKVEESVYYRELAIYQNENTNNTRAEMQFTVAGFHFGLDSATTIKLVEPSSVTINNRSTTFYDARERTDLLGSGSYYYVNLSKEPPGKQIPFLWERKNGSLELTTLAMPEPASIAFLDATTAHSRSEDLKLKVTGKALKKNESLNVSLSVKPDDSDIPADQSLYFSKDVKSVGDIVITAAELANLLPGQTEIKIQRVMNETNEEVKILKFTQYTGKTLKFELTE